MGRRAQIRREIVSRAMAQAISRREQHHAETTAQIKGEIAKANAFIAPDGTADVTNPEAQRERYLYREEFVRRLQKLNSNLIYERSKEWPDFGGLYLQVWEPTTLTGLVEKTGKRFLCGIPHEAISEFDVRVVIEEKIPDPDIPLHWITMPALQEHIPGWRSTIKKLVNRGIINLDAADREFDIRRGRSSELWQKAIQ